MRLEPAIGSLSRALFIQRELSQKEFRSVALLIRFLGREGFRVKRGVARLPTAFVARKRGRAGGHRVALLAEYDALPGVGHGCGHNLIGAAACGAAAAIGRCLGEARGEILVIGTPAEETIGGKALMAERGVFNDVDAAMMFHPSTENRVYTRSLACHSLEVTFRGAAAHAVASPGKGINALDALIRLFMRLKRLKRSLPSEVHMPGVIVEGGERANIVPDRAVGQFSLRARDLASLARLEGKFRSEARAAAREIGARCSIRPLDHPYAEMLTNATLADLFRSELARMGRRTVDARRASMGSLDMGNVSQLLPSIHPFVAIAPRSVPLHSRRFAGYAGGARGLSGLRVATRALAFTSLEILAGDGTLERARREFHSARRRMAAGRRGRRVPT